MVTKSRGSGNTRYPRVRDPSACSSDAPPPGKPRRNGERDKRPFQGCISADWAARTHFDKSSLPEDPAEFFLHRLSIRDTDLDETDQAWLADNEE